MIDSEIKILLNDEELNHSNFQIENFIVGSQVGKWAQYKQCLREISSRFEQDRGDKCRFVEKVNIFFVAVKKKQSFKNGNRASKDGEEKRTVCQRDLSFRARACVLRGDREKVKGRYRRPWKRKAGIDRSGLMAAKGA